MNRQSCAFVSILSKRAGWAGPRQPGNRRPVGKFAVEILLEKSFEGRIGERTALQVSGGFGGRQRLRVEAGAARQQRERKDGPLESQTC